MYRSLAADPKYTPLTYIRHWRTLCHMQFVETPNFTAAVRELLGEEEYREFQTFLMEQPDAGDVIQGTGGLRKVRWSAGGKGKRGGVRVIYYYEDSSEQFRMVLIYKK